jgi:hypothetical protein
VGSADGVRLVGLAPAEVGALAGPGGSTVLGLGGAAAQAPGRDRAVTPDADGMSLLERVLAEEDEAAQRAPAVRDGDEAAWHELALAGLRAEAWAPRWLDAVFADRRR